MQNPTTETPATPKENQIPTVEELRKSGAKVRINRLRLYQHNGSYQLFTRKHAQLMEQHFQFDAQPLATGGVTFVEIKKPDGEEVSGFSECMIGDNFVKNNGVKLAIARALGLPLPKY